jgi:hypothetical protein
VDWISVLTEAGSRPSSLALPRSSACSRNSFACASCAA